MAARGVNSSALLLLPLLLCDLGELADGAQVPRVPAALLAELVGVKVKGRGRGDGHLLGGGDRGEGEGAARHVTRVVGA